MKIKLVLAIFIVFTVLTNTISAQETNKKSKIKYENSKFQTQVGIPPIPAPNVTVKKVVFLNRDMKVAGLLYTPKERVKGKKYSAIVVGHPFNGVKEQTSGLHAAMLAELGYVTLAYDATHYGESEGEPRQEEVVSDRVEDFSAAVDYLTTLDFVDPERIGVLGICASGGYAVSAAQQEARFKAVATISMFNMGQVHRTDLGDPKEVLKAVGAQRTREANGDSLMMIAPLPNTVDENAPQIMKDFHDYYFTPRGQHPRNLMQYSYRSVARLINFYPFDHIETISPRPILFIVGENAQSKYFTDEAFSKAIEPKELFIVPGAGHVDLYDQPKYTAISVKKLDEFFSKYLGK